MISFLRDEWKILTLTILSSSLFIEGARDKDVSVMLTSLGIIILFVMIIKENLELDERLFNALFKQSQEIRELKEAASSNSCCKTCSCSQKQEDV